MIAWSNARIVANVKLGSGRSRFKTAIKLAALMLDWSQAHCLMLSAQPPHTIVLWIKWGTRYTVLSSLGGEMKTDVWIPQENHAAILLQFCAAAAATIRN